MSITILSSRAMPATGAFDSWRRLFASLRMALRRDAAADNAASRTEQAANVRAMALKYLRTEPGFAADLYAAADYHERGPHARPASPASKAQAR